MKKLVTTLAALILVSSGIGVGVATPSIAAQSLGGALAECTAPDGGDSNWNYPMMAGELRDLGVKYESIDRFGNCFIVRAKNSDGTVTNQLYDPQSLNRVY